MIENKEYNVVKTSLIFFTIILGFISIIGIPLSLLLLISLPLVMKWFPVLWIIILGFLIINHLNIPNKIILTNDNSLIFISILKQKEIKIIDIKSIKTNINSSYTWFKYNNGKIAIINRVNGLHELITEIKKLNISIQTKGC